MTEFQPAGCPQAVWCRHLLAGRINECSFLVCKKQLRASLNEQPEELFCILTAVLNCNRRGESKVTSWKGERKNQLCWQ